MKTKIVSIIDVNKSEKEIKEATKLLKDGEVVAFPTETVYGLGADAKNPEAVAKIFAAKGRPADNPLIVHIADMKQLPEVVKEVPPIAKRLMDIFWPGPLSIVLPKNPDIPAITTAGLDTVVVRFPKHHVAHALIKNSNLLIAAPSANLSGKVSPTKAVHVFEDLLGRIPMIIDGGDIEYGLESTVVDCTVTPPVILRPGSITHEVLQLVIPDIEYGTEISEVKAPGMKYQHYSPTAHTILFEGEPKMTCQKIHQYQKEHSGKKFSVIWHQPEGEFPHCYKSFRLSDNPEAAATELFDKLRAADDPDTDAILIQGYGKSGVGTAIMNRLEKAANKIIKVDNKD